MMAFISAELCSSITVEYLDKLHDAGYWTVNDISSTDLMEVKRKTNIKFQILLDLQNSIKKRYTLPSNDLCFHLEKSIRDCKMCPTGLPELTAALDGGYQTQEIVEFCGDSESGKTEMCYLLCGEILSHFEDFNILYVAANHDFDQEKVIKYTKIKAGNRLMDDDDLFKALNRIDIARCVDFHQLTHLLNSIVHTDRKNSVKCLIIDSLSFIIQDDILDMKTANLNDGDELKRFSAYVSKGPNQDVVPSDIIEVYLREVMRLLTNFAQTKNVIVVLTNSDNSLDMKKSWTNAIDHRINLSKMHHSSKFKVENSRATVCRATIMKTIHNVCKLGYSIPFSIDDSGLFAIRSSSLIKEDSEKKEAIEN